MQNATDLHLEVQTLKQKLEQQQDLLQQKNHYIKQLEAAILAARRQRYAPSSEKIPTEQLTLDLFNEAEEEEMSNDESDQKNTITVASHQRKKTKSAAIPKDLPREEIIYDLNDAEKQCPHDGTQLVPMGEEVHEQLDIIPAQIKVLKHIRKKYACPCCESYVTTAQKPPQPIAKSIASPGLLAYVAINKYADALPLYRQSEIFKRIGVAIDRTNLARWMVRCGQLAQPLINLLSDKLLEQFVLHMDESNVQVLKEPGKTPQSKSYMWVLASGMTNKPCVYFIMQQVVVAMFQGNISMAFKAH